jgi:hypothetical protein
MEMYDTMHSTKFCFTDSTNTKSQLSTNKKIQKMVECSNWY